MASPLLAPAMRAVLGAGFYVKLTSTQAREIVEAYDAAVETVRHLATLIEHERGDCHTWTTEEALAEIEGGS